MASYGPRSISQRARRTKAEIEAVTAGLHDIIGGRTARSMGQSRTSDDGVGLLSGGRGAGSGRPRGTGSGLTPGQSGTPLVSPAPAGPASDSSCTAITVP